MNESSHRKVYIFSLHLSELNDHESERVNRNENLQLSKCWMAKMDCENFYEMNAIKNKVACSLFQSCEDLRACASAYLIWETLMGNCNFIQAPYLGTLLPLLGLILQLHPQYILRWIIDRRMFSMKYVGNKDIWRKLEYLE